ncbi:MAG: RNA polymerase sigma factor [Candidatus Paceibacterota bacterium]
MLFTDQNDEQIITEYLSSNKEEVFRFLLNKYDKHAYNFVRQMVVNNNDAEDITQEVFIKIWKNLKKYKNGQNFKTWFFTIAKNTTIDFLRKKKSIVFSDLESKTNEIGEGDSFDFSETIESNELLPDEIIQKIQDREYLNKLLSQISTIYKTILLLHYQEEMTFEEIGKILDKPLNTVKSYHRRAIIKLREIA